jgi:hypothetical protein
MELFSEIKRLFFFEMLAAYVAAIDKSRYRQFTANLYQMDIENI